MLQLCYFRPLANSVQRVCTNTVMESSEESDSAEVV